jgi:hypothetical protein
METESFVDIDFDTEDRRYLSAALGMLSQRSTTPEAQAAYGLLFTRVKDGRSVFTKGESDLMLRIITATLEAGKKVSSSNDEGAQVRAAAVEAAYNAIKGKIENGKPK